MENTVTNTAQKLVCPKKIGTVWAVPNNPSLVT